MWPTKDAMWSQIILNEGNKNSLMINGDQSNNFQNWLITFEYMQIHYGDY